VEHEIRFTEQAARWFEQLPPAQRDRVAARVDRLARTGPGLGRPSVDTITGSRHPNMKELRVPGRPLRALFAFDRQRRAVVLVGGDKAQSKQWYRHHTRIADRLFTRHLNAQIRTTTWAVVRAGQRSDGPVR
jgi:hypothetical protein